MNKRAQDHDEERSQWWQRLEKEKKGNAVSEGENRKAEGLGYREGRVALISC